jgi:hypothetical protein
MATPKLHHAFILGAGFSTYAGMPLQQQFTSALLSGKGSGTGPSGKIVQHLRQFIREEFDHNPSAPADYGPDLEDIFTCIDLAANSGHNLGPDEIPSDLRTVRRALIYRIITMLRERYLEARNTRGAKWRKLVKLMKSIDPSEAAFISTNWDTVIEDLLQETHKVEWFDYGCGALHGTLHPAKPEIKIVRPRPPFSPSVTKMHGSVNWLYCDNCRRLYWFSPHETYKVAGQLLSAREWKGVDPHGTHSQERWSCAQCSSKSIGTRLATFSYLKALDFPMFQKSWFSAERILRNARTWIFIGYSLPAADFEFKFLLKRIQLARPEPPDFVVVSGGGRQVTRKTYEHYQRFFGRKIKWDKNFFRNGLDPIAIDYIAGILK